MIRRNRYIYNLTKLLTKYIINMKTITILKEEFEKMKLELETLRNSELYERLLEFEKNIKEGKIFTREDLGF